MGLKSNQRVIIYSQNIHAAIAPLGVSSQDSYCSLQRLQMGKIMTVVLPCSAHSPLQHCESSPGRRSCQVSTHLFLHDVSQVCGTLGGSYLQVRGSNQKHWQSLVVFGGLGTPQINNPKRDNPFLALEFISPGYWESSSRGK